MGTARAGRSPRGGRAGDLGAHAHASSTQSTSQLGVPGLGARHLRGAGDLCRAGVAPARGESAEPRDAGATTPAGGPRPQWYVTARQAALRREGLRGRPDGGQPRGAAHQPGQGRGGRGCLLTGAIRVLRASGAAKFLQRARCSSRGCPSAARHLDEAGDERETWSAFSRWTTIRRALDQPWCRPRRCCVRDGPAEGLAIIDDAERAASDDAASSMPRTCLERGRALLALDRLDEATELVAHGQRLPPPLARRRISRTTGRPPRSP